MQDARFFQKNKVKFESALAILKKNVLLLFTMMHSSCNMT